MRPDVSFYKPSSRRDRWFFFWGVRGNSNVASTPVACWTSLWHRPEKMGTGMAD